MKTLDEKIGSVTLNLIADEKRSFVVLIRNIIR